MKKLALLGGKPVIDKKPPKSLFWWPIITQEDEEAALDVIRNNTYSETELTETFEKEFCDWLGVKYAAAYCNGTMSLTAAMFAVGLGMGDEIICTTKTYWASITQAITFGATPVFCNIDDTLCMDPNDLERCITPKTKAIMVVHYAGHPCDMDAIMEIAKKHGILVIEDVSHAQGGYYKGRRLGTIGDIAAMSLMSGKSFAAGELGILVTNNRKLYERGLAYGHYNRNNPNYIIESEDLKPYFGLPLGGAKGRANQLCVALARVQLKYYDERIAEIDKAMNYFWDLLEGVPGIRPIRVDKSTGSTMAGWYSAQGLYLPEELGGLSVNRFCDAVFAEIDGICWPGANFCLHTHEYFRTFDYFNTGAPTRIAFNDRDARLDDASLKPSEEKYCFAIPWFKHFDKEWIEAYAAGYRKVAENYQQLLEGDDHSAQGGRWFGKENIES